MQCICALRIPENALAIVCHNPGITDLANTLCPLMQIDNMSTGSVFAVRAEVNEWKDFLEAEKEFLFFAQPKMK
jgi:phosphohistidine phosphatase